MSAEHAPAQVVATHLDAFQARDLDAVLDTFADDATFSTADGVVVGRRAIARLFADAFALDVQVRMDRHAVHVAGDVVTVEMTEHITAVGRTVAVDVAGVYVVRGGRLVRVRVYRDLAG